MLRLLCGYLRNKSWLDGQDQQFFYNGIRALKKRWTRCISIEGDYVEKEYTGGWSHIPKCYIFGIEAKGR